MKLNETLAGYGTTIFTVMTQLANDQGSINLGQGFPDVDGPDEIKDAAARAMRDLPNQYPPMLGLPELRQAAAEHSARFYGIEADWKTQTVITVGATEALAACILGFINPGDEAVVIEPVYDSYAPMIQRAGGIVRTIRLEPPHFELEDAALDAAFSLNTKMLILNNPQNPCGKVFTEDELGRLAERVIAADAIAVCDEVYEHIVFDGRRHIPLMTFPGMAERSVRIGSAGKTFSLTGWKIGYTTGAPDLIKLMAKAHQFVTFTVPPMLQIAIAEGLRMDEAYFQGLGDEMQAKRDLLIAGLEGTGLDIAAPAGTYFLTARLPDGKSGLGDEGFCMDITKNAGVTALPFSAFYLPDPDKRASDQYVRFCFCKRDAVLNDASARLRDYLGGGSAAA